jgi:four helix bundle protein
MPKSSPSAPASPPYERLEAWRACHELSLVVYRATKKWPASERFGLASEVRNAALSAAAKLVEGTARGGSKELKHFVELARGSLKELEYLLMLAHDLGVIDAQEHRLLHGFVDRAGQLTGGLHRALRKRTTTE